MEVGEAMKRNLQKKNLVIFGIEETNDEMKIRAKIKEIVLAVGLVQNKVKYFGRIGRNPSGNKVRMVRVVCKDSRD